MWQTGDAMQRGALDQALRVDAAIESGGQATAIQGLLGLVMIVKNEAHGIRETLESFKPFINRWTILDTGSTDGTQDVIRRVLDGIPGSLHEEPFVDFATSRNRALELHGDPTTYTVMPDGDDRLINGEALRSFLETRGGDGQAAYLTNLRRGTLSYWLPLILRTSAGWRYHGVVHEFIGPIFGEGFATTKIPDVQFVQDSRELSLEASRKRWTRDLVLLKAELAVKPSDGRTLFYLGQTYECLNDPQEALRVYERRIAVGGWAEETFEAYLRRAKILDTLKKPWPEIQQAYLDAYRFDGERAEPLFQIAEHWYCEQVHELTYLFAARAADLPPPSSTLFVDEEVYTWKAADLAATSGYYLNDPAARKKGRELAEQCVRVRPEDERLRANWAFYARPASELFAGYHSKPIGFVPEPPYVATSPSIHYDRTTGKWRCIARTTDRSIVNGQYSTPDDNVTYIRNFMLELDGDLDVSRTFEMRDKTGIPRSSFTVHGFEDCRLFNHLGRLCCIATVCDFTEQGTREIALVELDADYAISAATPLRGPWSDVAQKNWVPVEGDPAKLIYAIAPEGRRGAVVFDLDGTTIAARPMTCLEHGRLCGGSQAIRVDDGWLCIVRDVAWPGSGPIYLHRFVLLSDDFQLVGMSDPFFFERKGIEFCAGLAYDAERLVASFGVEGAVVYFGIFSLAAVRSQLRPDFQI
jgi:glycosyltransferase involved in cell wall biosynthesis